MIRDFSREELEPVEGNHTELTLGLGTVLGLGAGLLLLCLVCFALGYAVGHRAPADQEGAVVVPNSKTTTLPASGGAKPGAVRQAAAAPSPDAAGSDSYGQASAKQPLDDAAADSSQGQPPTAAANPQVRPALQSSTDQASPLHVQPATSSAQGWMVQIAAVSRSEDADVLVNALRKRGYAVTERRELGDNLIHVQTGPFTSRNDANTMRQKLLNDGYNAIVQ
jgi:DedD protein